MSDLPNLIPAMSYPKEVYFPTPMIAVDKEGSLRSPVGLSEDLTYTIISDVIYRDRSCFCFIFSRLARCVDSLNFGNFNGFLGLLELGTVARMVEAAYFPKIATNGKPLSTNAANFSRKRF